MSATQLVESFFRHEYSRVVAMLARRVGMADIALVEDAVQSTMILALERWKVAGVPDQPTAWMYRVAYNAVIDALRKQARHERILMKEADLEHVASERDSESLQSWEVNDAMLRMLFVCCDDALPAQSQLIMALKTLCGLSLIHISEPTRPY